MRSSRPASNRRHDRRRCRPHLESLEPRLPPGDTLLGILAGGSLLGTEQSDRESVSDSVVRLACTPNVAATSATIAEVAALSEHEPKDDRAAALLARRQRSSDSESAVTNSWNDSLTAFTSGPMPVGRPQLLPVESGTALESTPMLSSPIGGMPAANPFSIQRGLSAIVVPPPQTTATPAADAPAKSEFQTPFYFEKNVGQAGDGLDFVARGTGYTLGLSATEAIMALPGSSETNLVRMQLVGGNSHAPVTAVDPLVTKVNYFLGNDPNQWHTNIPTFGRVQYDDVYPGIDLAYYGNNGQLEYDFIVSPGADPNAITLNFAGADGVDVNGDGDLILHTAAGDVVQQAPLTYQEFSGARREVPSRYVIDGGSVSFDVGAYDASRPLVIDPLVLGYSTYLGAGGLIDAAYDIAADNNGHAYVVGETRSYKFPVTDGAFDDSYNGGTDDAFVAKLNEDGSGLIYATYLGGGAGDLAEGIFVDDEGNAYVTGETWSTSFPTTPGVFDETFNGNSDGFAGDGYVTKLSPDGSTLIYSTFLGGRYSDRGNNIGVDDEGNAYVVGTTWSVNFPVTLDAFGTSYNGGGDAFVTKLNAAGSALVYSTYVGGVDVEQGYGIAIDASGQTYVVGTTESLNFPTTPGAVSEAFNGGDADAFLAKLSAEGTTLLYSTYLGGSASVGDGADDIAVDADGNAYVAGATSSVDFPVTPGAFDTQHNVIDGNDGFLTKLNADGSGLVYSTFLSAGSTGAGAIALDSAGNAYVAGSAGSGLATTSDAFQKTWQGSGDAFFMKLNAAGSTLIYSTYLGGTSNSDIARGIALDVGGSAYITGETRSGDFPTTPNALKRRNRPNTTDGFVSKFAEV